MLLKAVDEMRVPERLEHMDAVRKVAGSNPTRVKTGNLNSHCSPSNEWVLVEGHAA